MIHLPKLNLKRVMRVFSRRNAYITLTAFALVAIGWTVYQVNDWFNKNYFQFNAPVTWELHPVVEIKKREAKTIVQVQVVEYPGEVDTPIKKYICDKFGIYDCKIALGVVQAESGFNEQNYHANSDGSIDIGLFQINSIHFKQAGCSLKEVVDPYKNTDCAYNIYLAAGKKWGDWVTFNNGNYLLAKGGDE